MRKKEPVLEEPSSNSTHAKSKPKMSNQMSEHHGKHHGKHHGEKRHHGKKKFTHTRKKSQLWRCHYCGSFGHIRPFSFKFYGYPKTAPLPNSDQISQNSKKKKQWVTKTIIASLIAHTSLRVSTKDDWYFDSGCSRHMTCVKNLLVDIKSHSTSYVTFGDGAKGEIKGVGKLECSGVPKLNNVLLVKGLTANLICISQLCDKGFKVNFTKT